MGIRGNTDGDLDLEALTPEERTSIFELALKLIQDADTVWEEKYGPFERLELSEMTLEEANSKLDEIDDSLIWTDVNYAEGSMITPVEGLSIQVNGWAKFPGRDTLSLPIENFLIATKPWEGNPLAFDPVYSYATCYCPFCEDGEIDGEECTACWGSGEWELEN